MKFFLDTAHLDDIIRIKKTGLLEGITTNPTHLSKEDTDPTVLVKEIAAVMYPHDVSVEVTENNPEAVYSQAYEISSLAPNIVVKIPCHTSYLPIITRLAQEGIPLNITLLFSAVQGLCMAKLGVKYISPFVGRLEDADSDGIGLLKDLKAILQEYDFKTQILAASLRSVSHVHQAALSGADVATVPVKIFDHLLEHPLTDAGMHIFAKDWKKLEIKKFP